MELTLSLGCNNTFHESPTQMDTKIDMMSDQHQFSIGDDIGRFIRSKLDNTTSFDDVSNHNQPLQILLLPNNPDNKLPSSGRITTTIKRKRSSDIMTESDLFETTMTLDRRSSGCTGTTTTSTDDEGHQENMNMAAAMTSCNKKLRLSREQSAFLEDSFKEQSNLNPKQKLALAKQLNLRPRQVEVWFQNRRARTKLKQTEVECDYLKRRCESLTEENKRLQKEVMELRALKATSIHPFFSNMQQPPTTLTLCPSCHRSPPACSRAPENAS